MSILVIPDLRFVKRGVPRIVLREQTGKKKRLHSNKG